MTVAYADFLAGKERRAGAVGRCVDRSAVHPMLHEWQARTVQWAVAKGRCAIWWDCGLGKTFFAGIGSEGYQSLLRRRRFVGCELKPSYFATAVDNLRRAAYERDLPSLFDSEAAS